MKILVTGATGFIGSNLVPILKKKYSVRVLVRNKKKFKQRGVEVFVGDLNDKDAMVRALRGIEVTYYLVHSMNQSSRFEEMEAKSAKNFAFACNANKVKRVIYLSGIIPEGKMSRHLRSRKRVGNILRKSRTRVTEFRSSIIVGKEGPSFVIIQRLVEKIPILFWSKKIKDSLNQPIGLEDTLYYLVKSLEEKKTIGKTYDIGGRDVITFKSMLTIYAEEIGKKRKIIYLPFFSSRLFAYIASKISKQPKNLIQALIESLKHDVVCGENKIRKIMPRKVMGYKEAVRASIEQ